MFAKIQFPSYTDPGDCNTSHISFASGLTALPLLHHRWEISQSHQINQAFLLFNAWKKPWRRQTEIQTDILIYCTLYSEHSLRRGNITGVFCQLVWWRKNIEGLYKYLYAAIILPGCSLCSKSAKRRAKFRVLTWRLDEDEGKHKIPRWQR